MRLSSAQLNKIKSTIHTFIKKKQILYKLYLYGSRLDDNKKGGDIDLIIVVDKKDEQDQIIDEKYKILANLYKEIGEQKIDILITTKDKLKTDNFLKIIIKTAKEII